MMNFNLKPFAAPLVSLLVAADILFVNPHAKPIVIESMDAYSYPVYLHFPDGSTEVCSTDHPGAVQMYGTRLDADVIECHDVDAIFKNGFEGCGN